MIPCQDTPSVKTPYSAEVRLYPVLIILGRIKLLKIWYICAPLFT